MWLSISEEVAEKTLMPLVGNWQTKSNARFVCSMTLYYPDGKSFSSTGTINGKISAEKKGRNGFGYDPIFIPKGKKKTFGEINPAIKYKIDHRYFAFKKLRKFL